MRVCLVQMKGMGVWLLEHWDSRLLDCCCRRRRRRRLDVDDGGDVLSIIVLDADVGFVAVGDVVGGAHADRRDGGTAGVQ